MQWTLKSPYVFTSTADEIMFTFVFTIKPELMSDTFFILFQLLVIDHTGN